MRFISYFLPFFKIRLSGGGHDDGVHSLLAAAPPAHAPARGLALIQLPEVAESVVVAVPRAAVRVRGAGERGGAGHLAHRAQRVGLLRGGGLVAPGDWGVHHPVGS